jgi:hypothetical protein
MFIIIRKWNKYFKNVYFESWSKKHKIIWQIQLFIIYSYILYIPIGVLSASDHAWCLSSSISIQSLEWKFEFTSPNQILEFIFMDF